MVPTTRFFRLDRDGYVGDAVAEGCVDQVGDDFEAVEDGTGGEDFEGHEQGPFRVLFCCSISRGADAQSGGGLWSVKVNPSVLGGLVVDFGEKTVDLSVSSRISKLNNLLQRTSLPTVFPAVHTKSVVSQNPFEWIRRIGGVSVGG